ncbi:MAG: DUF305 domain-containing protein [Chloroflexia bacterium]|nr:DUF305 domain-containing protein [Chloroflexia bacterium]
MRIKQTAVAALLIGVSILAPAVPPTAAQQATPTTTVTCEDVIEGQSAGTPAGTTGDEAGMAMGTPMAEMDHMAMELDQAYIDMMIPHHASIIAMAQAALPRLSDERLQEIAQTIIKTQSAEIEELRGYREAFYGEAEPMPMDEGMMEAMGEMMPGMSGSIEEMAVQMDAAAQVAAICAADDVDPAFIDQTIPHHQMAIEASGTAAAAATHAEIREFAQRVIEDQKREVNELSSIAQELAGGGTPIPSSG